MSTSMATSVSDGLTLGSPSRPGALPFSGSSVETEVTDLRMQVGLLQAKLAELEQSVRFFSNNIPKIHNAEAYFDVVETAALMHNAVLDEVEKERKQQAK